MSSEFDKDSISAKNFMKGSAKLWEDMSHYLEIIFPSVHKEIVGHDLPDGLYPLAGMFMGCVVNIHDGESPVETNVHRDVKERPFIPSCLCPIGDFTGGELDSLGVAYCGRA